MKCPNCGYNGPDDAVYCSNCGSLVSPESRGSQENFICIVVLIGRSPFFGEYPPIAGGKARDPIDDALSRCSAIARRYNADSMKISADSQAILYPIDINNPTQIDGAIDFAISLRNDLSDMFVKNAEDLTLRIGVDIGEITYHDFVLTATTGKYSPVNNATRLGRKAAPNSILISDTVAQFLGEGHNLKPIGFYQLHGSEDALKIYEITRVDRRSTITPPPAPIDTIGFSSEIDEAIRILQTAVDEEKPVFLPIIGEPGSGKTEFIDRIIEKLTFKNWFTIRLFGRKKAKTEPYFLLRQLAAQLSYEITEISKEKTEKNPEVGQLIEYSVGLKPIADYTELSHYRPLGGLLEETLTEAIKRRYNKQPTVIVVDDFHFADNASAEFLKGLNPILDNLPISVVVVSEPNESIKDLSQKSLTIPELNRKIANEIRNSFHWKTAPGNGLIKRCIDLSERAVGRFVVILRYLNENPSFTADNNAADIPGEIGEILDNAFGYLDETAKTIINILNATNTPLSLKEIGLYLGAKTDTELTRIEEFLTYLTDKTFVNRIEYNDVLKYLNRASFHIPPDNDDGLINRPDYQNILSFLIENDYPYATIIADIATLARDPNTAVRALISAAQMSYLYGLSYDVISLLTSAIEIAEKENLSDDLKYELYSFRGEVYGSEGLYSGAKQDFESALTLTEPVTDEYALTSFKKCALQIKDGQFEEASKCLKTGKTVMETKNQKQMYRVFETSGDLHLAKNDPVLAENDYKRALSLAIDNDTRYRLLVKMGKTRFATGEIQGAIEYTEEALEIAEREGDPKTKADLFLELSRLLPYRMDFDRVIYLLNLALSWYENVADYRGQLYSYINLANSELQTSNRELFLEAIGRCKRILENAPDNDITARILWMEAYFDITVGDESGFIEKTSQRPLKLSRLETPAANIATQLLISNIEANVTGDFDAALKAAKKAAALLVDCNGWLYRSYTDIALATALRGLGKKNDALSLLLTDEHRNLAKSNPMYQIDYFMILGLLHADSGNVHEGIKKLKLAASVAKSGGIKFLEARCYLELASIVDGQESADMSNRAIWLFDTIGSDFWRKKAENLTVPVV